MGKNLIISLLIAAIVFLYFTIGFVVVGSPFAVLSIAISGVLQFGAFAIWFVGKFEPELARQKSEQ